MVLSETLKDASIHNKTDERILKQPEKIKVKRVDSVMVRVVKTAETAPISVEWNQREVEMTEARHGENILIVQ